MFEGLRSEVEAVFMEAPTVNLEALAIQSGVMGPKLEEMVSNKATEYCLALPCYTFA